MKEDTTQQLNEDFIETIFALLYKKQEYFSVISKYLKDNFISGDSYQKLWTQIKKSHKVKDRLPSISILKQIFSKNESILDILDRIKDIDIDRVDEVLEIFEDFIKQSKFIELYEGLPELYNSGNKDKAYQFFIRGAEDLSNFTIKDVQFEKIMRGFSKRHIDRITGANRTKRDIIPTGIDEYDALIDGGAMTGETMLYLGDTGAGKSKLLVHHGIIAAKSGYGVLHIQAEGTKEQCLDNYDACWTGSLYKDIKRGDIGEKYKAYQKVVNNWGKGEIFVYCAEQFGKLSMLDVIKFVKDAKKTHPNIKVLLLDYLALFDIGDGQIYSPDNEKFRLKELGRRFKNIAVTENLLGITVAQSTTEKQELLNDSKFVMTRYNIGESKRLPESFSYFATLNQTRDEKRDKRLRIFFDKLRDHDSNQTITICQNLARSRFYDRKATFEWLSEVHEEDLDK